MADPETSYAFQKFSELVRATIDNLISNLNEADLERYFQLKGTSRAQIAIVNTGKDMQEKMLADFMESFIQISRMDGFVDHIHQSY